MGKTENQKMEVDGKEDDERRNMVERKKERERREKRKVMGRCV